MLSGLIRMMRFAGIIAVVFTFVGVSQSRAQALPKDLVKAELLADVASVKAGEPFTLGVLLTIKPGWHVYWKNPGDSGIATKVVWTMPNGYSIGAVNFPLPTRIEVEGKIVNIGYEDQVMLTAR